MIKAIKRFFVFLFNISKEPEKTLKRDDAKGVEESGQWYYLRDILDRLENTFRYLSYMAVNDPVAYHIYSNVGGYVIGPNTLLDTSQELNPEWRAGARPAFGMIALGDIDLGDKIQVKMHYFMKIDNKCDVEPYHGDTYEVTLFYVDDKNESFRVPAVFYVGIDSGCKITLLKQRKERNFGKPSRGRSRQGWNASQTVWGYPELLRDNAKRKKMDLNDYAAVVFALVVNPVQSISAGAQVRVDKGLLSLLFTIDTLRTPYFFKDRDMVVNEAGSRKKIFHIVRTHKRVLKDGTERYIKSHFRGSRKFVWNGYSVVISIPGLHHTPLGAFDATADVDKEDAPLKKGYIEYRRAAEIIRRHTIQ